MPIDWKTQHNEDSKSHQSDPQINFYQNLSKMFYKYRHAYDKVYMESQRKFLIWKTTPIFKKNKYGGITLPNFKTWR